MKQNIKKTLSVLLAAIMLLVCAAALAEVKDGDVADLPKGGTTFESNGISVSYNKYNFKCDMDEHGDLKLTYLGESDAPVIIGIKHLAGNTVDDVLDGMKKTIENNKAEVVNSDFGDNVKNATFVTWQKKDGKNTLHYQKTLIPQKDGVYVVSIESFVSGDNKADAERTAMIEQIVDSIRLTGRDIKAETKAVDA